MTARPHPSRPSITLAPEASDAGAPDEPASPSERPTVAPPFDVAHFARESMSPSPTKRPPGPTPSTPPASGRATQPTLTNEAELEMARRRSAESDPSSLLSMADAAAPASDAVPRAARFDPEEAPTARKDLAAPPVDASGGGIDVDVDLGEAVEATDPIREMSDRMSLGDYSGALALAERVLEANPANEAARACVDECRTVLVQMYSARLGPLDRVPIVVVSPDQLRWLSIDHRAGFVLSHIDGVSTLDVLLDVSGMPQLDALRILCELVQQRVISFR